jgi:hypothetical protein
VAILNRTFGERVIFQNFDPKPGNLESSYFSESEVKFKKTEKS